MKIKRDTLLIVLCVVFFLLLSALRAINIQQEKVIQEQNRIIALQSEYQFDLETTIDIQEKYINDQEKIIEVYEDIIELHELMQEVDE